MALWLVLATLAFASPGGFISASNDTSGWPHITQCHFREIETFTCHWSYGDFYNLSGLIKLQYMKDDFNWTDCPDNVTAGENSCYFSKEHTSILVIYKVRLVNENVTFDELSFTVDSIAPPGLPRITQCRSQEMETFTCHWTKGNFHNLSGLIKLQYMKMGLNWNDCPDNVTAGENSCYFSRKHTSIFVTYKVRLVSEKVTFDEISFTVDDIVRPDPPISLNWTVVSVSDRMGIQLTWSPPASADVRSSWISLEYEVQIKAANENIWKPYDAGFTTDWLLYGLKTDTEYWVRVRCRQRGNEIFGEFSDVLVIADVTSLAYPMSDPRKLRSYTVDNTIRPSQKEVNKTSLLGWPSITQCRSPEQETFTCHWTNGNFHNLSGLIKLQYIKNGLNWTDCPDNVSTGENSCYFSRKHTSIWVAYKVRLVSENVTFDEISFTVDNIVRPDPPISLNWTVLNVSETRLRMDIQLTWNPPASADVKSGWLSLEYAVEIKVVNKTEWKLYDVVSSWYLPLYGLKTDEEYWVRVRCKQRGNEHFGEYSDVLVIPLFVSLDPPLLWPLFFIFILLGVVLVLTLIIFCKKKRLKMLILPPVPVPKIIGIDPVLLQKGKLDEVSSILASHENYKHQLCIDDPWVEFIELDLDDQDEKNEGADTDRLLGEEYPKAHNCLGVKDDDSGRASCCEPDIPETDFSNSDTCDGTSDMGQLQSTKDNQANLLCLTEKSKNGGSPMNSQMPNAEKISTKPEEAEVCPLLCNETPHITTATKLNGVGSKPNIDFYALVSDITPAGRLLLSPGKRLRVENEECSEPTIQHPTSPTADNSYICEAAVTAFCAVNFPTEASPNVQQSPNADSYFTPESLMVATMNSHSTDKASSYETPVAEYTSVHVVNFPQHLMLNTTAPPGKEFVTPCGYMSTDQVNKVML